MNRFLGAISRPVRLRDLTDVPRLGVIVRGSHRNLHVADLDQPIRMVPLSTLLSRLPSHIAVLTRDGDPLRPLGTHYVTAASRGPFHILLDVTCYCKNPSS